MKSSLHLLYAKGGAAVTDRNYEFVLPSGALGSSSGYDTEWSPEEQLGTKPYSKPAPTNTTTSTKIVSPPRAASSSLATVRVATPTWFWPPELQVSSLVI
jgi:hypothetical protein